ncbi:hypothetical protein G7Y79_00050g085680 [Physcia stellaris]|nr:hypothetical protein G7Y79_00050g085680 [Physcia stellaris]
MPKIYRVLKDYDLPTSTPPPNPLDAKIYTNDLVQALQPPSGGWVLVKKLSHGSTLPGLVPEDYVAKAKPGFYRTRGIIRIGDTKVDQGAIVQVICTRPSTFFASSDLKGCWVFKQIDGSDKLGMCLPWLLEAVEVPTNTQQLLRVFALSGRTLDLKRLMPTVFRSTGGPECPVGRSETPPPPYQSGGYDIILRIARKLR